MYEKTGLPDEAAPGRMSGGCEVWWRWRESNPRAAKQIDKASTCVVRCLKLASPARANALRVGDPQCFLVLGPESRPSHQPDSNFALRTLRRSAQHARSTI